MKRLALFACLSASSFASVAADLHIKAGTTYIVDASKARMSVDNFIVEDKAQIRLANGVDLWVLEAKSAKIGYGVSIDGSGADGRDGSNGQSHREATSCGDGTPGGDGGVGGSGGNGASVHWNLGIESFGSVSVDLTGGNGGRGGNGGDGQNVPDFPQCTAAGGAAGDGGAGGSGGKGGSFRFHYTMEEGVDADLTNSMEVKISGGMRGKGGQPGLAGVGTSGYYANKKSLSGSRTWVAGGGDGTEGEVGRSGASGDNGSLDIRRIGDLEPETAVEPSDAEPVSKDMQQRVKDLEVLTQKLEARIRLLELDKQ